jgi:hypothetical protein
MATVESPAAAPSDIELNLSRVKVSVACVGTAAAGSPAELKIQRFEM